MYFLPVAISIVKSENFVNEQRPGPAVHKQMMATPDQAVIVVHCADETESHQRGGGKIETVSTTSFEVVVQTLLLIGG